MGPGAVSRVCGQLPDTKGSYQGARTGAGGREAETEVVGVRQQYIDAKGHRVHVAAPTSPSYPISPIFQSQAWCYTRMITQSCTCEQPRCQWSGRVGTC